MRKATFQGSSKTIANLVVQTLVFTPQDLESAGLVQLMFATTGAANTASVVADRIRVRAGGDVIIDCSWAQMQAFQQRWSNRFVANADADTTFSIPLNFLDAPRGMTGEQQDRCQFPPNREIQVELTTTAAAVTGTIMAGWKQTDRPAECFQRYYSSVLNIPGSATNARYNFAEPGILRGLTLPQANISRAELYVSDRQAWRLPGPTFAGGTSTDLLSQKDFFEDGVTETATKHHSVDLGIPAAAGSSYLLLDTAAGWSTANEGAFYAVVPLAAGK